MQEMMRELDRWRSAGLLLGCAWLMGSSREEHRAATWACCTSRQPSVGLPRQGYWIQIWSGAPPSA